jgi:hypothetical protein
MGLMGQLDMDGVNGAVEYGWDTMTSAKGRLDMDG